MKYLEEELSEEVYDQIRIALGLETKLKARKKGIETSKKMLETLDARPE